MVEIADFHVEFTVDMNISGKDDLDIEGQCSEIYNRLLKTMEAIHNEKDICLNDYEIEAEWFEEDSSEF